MGSKPSSQTSTNSTSSYTPPPEVLNNYRSVTQQAQNVASNPYQQFRGQLVSPLNAQQFRGISGLNNAAGMQNGYNAGAAGLIGAGAGSVGAGLGQLGGAAGLANASAGEIDPTQFSADALKQYESPFQSDVIKATMAEINNQNSQQASGLTGNAIAAGAFGGDRAGVAQAALAGQQDIASNATLANLNNQNFQQAVGEFNTQQGVNLAAKQNTAARQLAASGQLGNLASEYGSLGGLQANLGSQLGALGQTAQGEALTGANAQVNAGTLEQSTQQARDTAAYNQFLQRQAYPFQTTGWLANIVEGIGSQSGGTSTGSGTSTTDMSNAGLIAGGLLGLGSFLNRGGRVRKMADGGGLGGAVLFDPTSYAGMSGLGGGDIVPTPALQIGHTMPTQSAAPAAAAPTASPTQDLQTMQAVQKGFQGLQNSSLGDSVSDFFQDLGDGLARGGVVSGLASGSYRQGGLVVADGGLMQRPHFMGGGPTQNFQPVPGKPGMMTNIPTSGWSDTFGAGEPQTIQTAPSVARTPTPQAPVSTDGASYAVLPVHMSNGKWNTTQGLGGIAATNSLYDSAHPLAATGAAAPTVNSSTPLARGGLVPRLHFDDGGDVPLGDIDPQVMGLNPGLGDAPSPQDTAALRDAMIARQYANQMPAPSNAAGLAAAQYADQMPVPAATPVPVQSGLASDAPRVNAGDFANQMPDPMRDAAIINQPGLRRYADGSVAAFGPGLAVKHDIDGASAGPASSPAGGPTAHAADGTPVYTDIHGNAVGSPGLGAPMPNNGVPTQLPSSPGYNVYQGMIKRGFNPAQAATIAGNMQQESSFDPNSYNGKEGAVGLLQWRQSRAQDLQNFAAAQGKSASDPNVQMDFVAHEMQTTEAGNAKSFLSATTIPEANAALKKYIRYGDDSQETRLNNSEAIAAGGGSGSSLAYDATRRGGFNASPAAQAIDSAAAPGNGLGDAAAAPVAAPAAERSGLLGLNFSPETRRQMLYMGLGMMGGTSMNPFVNIGQGGLAGLNAANQAGNVSSEIALRNAQTQAAQTETQLKQQQLKMMNGALEELGGHAQKQAAAAERGAASAPASGAASPSAGASGPAALSNGEAAIAAPATNVGPQIDPDWDPKELNRKAAVSAFINPTLSQTYRDRADQIAKTGRVMLTNGQWANAPGYVKAEAEATGARVSAEEAAKAPYDMVQVQPEPGGPTYMVPKSQLVEVQRSNPNATTIGPGAGSPPGSTLDSLAAQHPAVAKQPEFYAERQKQIATEEGQMIDQYRQRQVVEQRLQTLVGIMQHYQPGAFAEQKSDIVAALRGVGIPVKDSDTANPAAFQEMMKNTQANVFDQAKALGGRILVTELTGLAKSNANPGMQPEADAAIMGQALGLAKYEDKHTEDYFNWKKDNQNATTTAPFEIGWAKANPVGEFVDKATKGIAYKGQEVPAPQSRVVGQSYMTPKGPMVWQGAGWTPAPVH